MLITSLDKSPKREREGLISHILLQHGDTPGNNLAITWVEVAPGHGQDDLADAKAGELVFIPSNVTHGIENTSSESLVYISASVPAFDLEALYDSGQLKQG